MGIRSCYQTAVLLKQNKSFLWPQLKNPPSAVKLWQYYVRFCRVVYKSMLSAAIHYATLNSFRSIKLPSSLYKPLFLIVAPPFLLSRGILLQGRQHVVLCRIYWAIAKLTVGLKRMHELVIFNILCVGSVEGAWNWLGIFLFKSTRGVIHKWTCWVLLTLILY